MGLGAFFSLSLILFSAEPMAFTDLSRVQQIEFRETWRQLYILGVPLGGIWQDQRQRIERAYEYYIEHKEAFRSPDFSFIFQLQQATLEWSYRFDQEFNHRAAILYNSSFQSLDPKATYIDVIKSLQLQIQLREEMIRYPLFADAQPLAGLHSYDLQIFCDLYRVQKEDCSLLQKFIDQEWLSENEFIQALQVISPTNTYQSELYEEYLFLGRIPRKQVLTREEFERHFVEAGKSLGRENNDFIQNLDFYYLLYQASHQRDWSLNWEKLVFLREDDLWELTGSSWIHVHYADRWPAFKDIGKLSPEELAESIEEYIELSGDFQDSEIQDFNDILLLLRSSGKWTFKDIPENLAIWLAAYTFPELKLKSALSILEGNFLELSEEEQQEALFHLPFPLEIIVLLKIELSKIDPRKREEVLNFHWKILETNFQIRFENTVELTAFSEVELINGKRLPKSSELREKMRQILNDPDIKKDYGFFPAWLIEPLIVHFFPSPNYWDLEIQKAKNEWSRQEILSEYSKQDQVLTEKDRKYLEQILFDKNGAPRTDLSSPLVFMSSFAYGFQNNPERILPAIGAGLLLHIVTKGIGGKIVLSLIVADTSIRLISASYYDEENQSWRDLKLEKGFSSAIGLWSAQELQRIYSILYSMSFPHHESERLWAFHDFGEWSFEAISFSLGMGLSESLIPWKRLARLHSIRSYSKQLDRLARSRDKIFDLQRRVIQRQKALESSLPNHDFRTNGVRNRLREHLDLLEFRLSETQITARAANHGLLSRGLQGLKLIFRWGSQFYALPLKGRPHLIKWNQRIQNRSLRSRRSLLEIQQNWRRIEAKLTSKQDLFVKENLMPKQLQAHHAKLEHLTTKIDQDQMHIAIGLEEYRTALEALRSITNEKKIQRSLKPMLSDLESILKKSHFLSQRFKEAIDSLHSFQKASRKVPTQSVEWWQHLRSPFKAIQRARETQAVYDIAWARYQLDWYHQIRQQWQHWQRLWARERRLMQSSDFAWDRRLDSIWDRHLRVEAELKEAIKLLDESFAPIAKQQMNFDRSWPGSPNRRFLSWKDYLDSLNDSRAVQSRQVLSLSELRDVTAKLQSLSIKDLPPTLRQQSPKARWYHVQDGNWHHYIIIEENSGLILSGRNIAGQWRRVYELSLSPH